MLIPFEMMRGFVTYVFCFFQTFGSWTWVRLRDLIAEGSSSYICLINNVFVSHVGPCVVAHRSTHVFVPSNALQIMSGEFYRLGI